MDIEKLINNQWAIAQNLQSRLYLLSSNAPESQGTVNCGIALDHCLDVLMKLQSLLEDEEDQIPTAEYPNN